MLLNKIFIWFISRYLKHMHTSRCRRMTVSVKWDPRNSSLLQLQSIKWHNLRKQMALSLIWPLLLLFLISAVAIHSTAEKSWFYWLLARTSQCPNPNNLASISFLFKKRAVLKGWLTCWNTSWRCFSLSAEKWFCIFLFSFLLSLSLEYIK